MSILEAIQTLYSKIPWDELLVIFAALGALYLKYLGTSVNKVKNQVTKNGGTSLLDAVNRIELRLAELTSLNEATHQLSQLPMFKTNEKGECIWVNTAYTAATGKSIEDLKGHGWISIVHEDDRKEVIEEWEKSVKDDRRFEFTYRVVNALQGVIHLVKCRSYPVILNHKIAGYLGVWYLIENDVDTQTA